jgi:hypothetical protein
MAFPGRCIFPGEGGTLAYLRTALLPVVPLHPLGPQRTLGYRCWFGGTWALALPSYRKRSPCCRLSRLRGLRAGLRSSSAAVVATVRSAGHRGRSCGNGTPRRRPCSSRAHVPSGAVDPLTSENSAVTVVPKLARGRQLSGSNTAGEAEAGVLRILSPAAGADRIGASAAPPAGRQRLPVAQSPPAVAE